MATQPPDQPVDDSKHPCPRPCRLDLTMTSCLLVVHCILAYALIFVKFGLFDPGDYGLGIDELIITLAGFLIVTVWALIRSCRRRRWWLAAGHALLLLWVILAM